MLIQNAILISMDEKREKIEPGMDIRIRKDKIETIGKHLAPEQNEKIIDATNKVVMPGLINTHAHIPMSIFRETVDGLPLQSWLQDKIWPMEDKLTKQDIYYASYLSFLEMIRTGTTTINDMYFMTEQIIEAAEVTGIRLQTTRTLMDLSGEEEGENRLKELKTLIKNYQGKDDRVTFNVGIHGLYTASKPYVEKCIAFAKENDLNIHMHFCENTKEVKDIEESYGKKPIEVLEELFSNEKVLLAHCVKLSKEEITRLSQLKQISISHCPVSNLKLGCGVANIAEMVKQGINVSIGTDGQGSGSNLDLWESMKYAALLQKGIEEDAVQMSAYEVLKMGTINGAKALGLEQKIGSVEEGKLADMIIINLDNIVMQPVNDIIADLIYNAKGNNVETSIVNGNILMENHQLQFENEEAEVIEKCGEIMKRIQ